MRIPILVQIIIALVVILFEGKTLSAQEARANSLHSVRELSAQGRHLDAILELQNEQENRSLGDIFAAARSAWALGLIMEARIRWEEAFEHPDCTGVERARALLSRSLMELQEEQYEEARSFAEEGSSYIDSSELRGQLQYVIAEALYAQNLYSLAEGYYKKAVSESSKEGRQEALLKLASVQNKLGRPQEARKSLVKIELSSRLTPIALNRLIEIDAHGRNSTGVRTWVEEGRNSFPSEFHTPKVGYAHARSLLADGLYYEAEEEISHLEKESKESDPWVQLGRALVEEYHAKQLIPGLDK